MQAYRAGIVRQFGELFVGHLLRLLAMEFWLLQGTILDEIHVVSNLSLRFTSDSCHTEFLSW